MRPKATLCALWAFLIPLCSSISCNQLSNPYDGPSNKQFEVICNSYSTGGDQIGPSFEAFDLEACIQLCVDIPGCKAALFDRSQYLCYLLDDSDGPADNSLYDMALLLSSAPTTTSDVPATTSDVPATTSEASATTSCNELDNPTYIDGVKFRLLCGNQATGGNVVDYSNQLQSLTECMAFCADTLACRAVTFDRRFNECYLYDGFNGFQNDFYQDMAVVASRPAVSSTTEALTDVSTSLSASFEISATIESTSESEASTLYTSSAASRSSGSPETISLSSSSVLTSETTSANTMESSSFTTTLIVTSDATTSLTTASSLFTSLSSSQDTPSGTTSDSALQSTLEYTLESTIASAASATTSLEAISLSTRLSVSLSSESVSESTSDAQLVSTSPEESASLEPTTVATSIVSIHTDTTSIEMLTTETSDITTSATAIGSTSTGSSLSDASRVSTELQSTPEVSVLPSVSSTPSAGNIPTIDEYTFTGCLKSLEGYPSFQEVATDPKMTTRKCVDLALGSDYIGVYQETCYKADVLDDTEFISEARCDLPCPGDPTLFCGGILGSGQRLLHRAIAPNQLLTLYRKKLPFPSDVLSPSASEPPSSSLQATGSNAYETTSESKGPSHPTQTESLYSFSSFTTRDIGSKTLSVSDSTIPETNSETRVLTTLPTPTAIHTAYSTLTIDHTYTRTQLAETVTTVTYTTVNPSNPASLITTCVPITLLYSPCRCKHQVYPTVDLTTVACTQGEDIVTLTVPKAAYATGSVSNTHPIVQYPSGWIGEHQTHGGSNGYPTGRPTGGSQPGSKNGQPAYPTVATGVQDSHPSYKAYQPATPTSVGGSNVDHQPEQENPQPSVLGQGQGSAESINNTPMNPSQPSSPNGLTTETRIIPTSQVGNSALPSQSSPLDHGQAPSKSTGVPYATPVVVSEAQRYDFTSWIMITAVIGVFLL